jgi:hypothetical protein
MSDSSNAPYPVERSDVPLIALAVRDDATPIRSNGANDDSGTLPVSVDPIDEHLSDFRIGRESWPVDRLDRAHAERVAPQSTFSSRQCRCDIDSVCQVVRKLTSAVVG